MERTACAGAEAESDHSITDLNRQKTSALAASLEPAAVRADRAGRLRLRAPRGPRRSRAVGPTPDSPAGR